MSFPAKCRIRVCARTGGDKQLKSHPKLCWNRLSCAFPQVCKLERMKVAFFFPVLSLPSVAASIACKCTGRQGFFFFNACMRIKGQAPSISHAAGSPLPAAATEPYPQPRDALIETCCQSDKHICIQSTLYLFLWKGLQSAVGWTFLISLL